MNFNISLGYANKHNLKHIAIISAYAITFPL